MSGIYIHIPFCKQACFYCNFHFSTNLKTIDDLVDAICIELTLRKDYLVEKKLDSIYLGGGTPSLLKEKHFKQIFDSIEKLYSIDKNAEITIEANPDDINKSFLSSLKDTPVNRLSIGIQSFFDDDLKFMNRAHNAQYAKACVKLAKEFGFNNLSLDLIYGYEGLTNEKWLENIHTAIGLGATHISSYALTVEPKTALANLIKKGALKSLNDEVAAEHFDILTTELCKHNFIHYEVSNFAKEGFIAKHNSNYWKGKPYLGLGPSAHSFNKTTRSWNIANNNTYIASISESKLNFTEEILSTNDLLNEYIMTGLRTIWGCDLNQIELVFGATQKQRIIKDASVFMQNDLLLIENNILRTTQKGKFLADGIASELFVI